MWLLRLPQCHLGGAQAGRRLSPTEPGRRSQAGAAVFLLLLTVVVVMVSALWGAYREMWSSPLPYCAVRSVQACLRQWLHHPCAAAYMIQLP